MRSMLQNISTEVAIVGLGPVGITLANILGNSGIDVVGIDARDDVYSMPRAVGMDHEVMRVFQNIGIAENLASVVSEYRDSIYRAADGAVLRRFTSPPPPYRLGWPAYLTFVQPELERKLRARATSSDTIRLLTGSEVIALENPESPRLTLRNCKTGAITELSARFVVGCDGGASFIRRSLGIKFEDLIFDQPWLVVDVLLGDGDFDLPETNVQFCNPARPHTFVICPGRLRRWEFMMLPGETADELDQPERIWQLLSPWLEQGQAEIWRSATYRFHALVAESWRVGQVFLAGDACHMTPPFLAQGMVQGIKDAANLGWKLAYVLKGGSDRVLATYQQERRPLVHKVISITKDLGHVICELDAEKVKCRDDELKVLAAAGRGTVVRQELFPPISAGVIALDAAGAPAPGAGEASPQPWVLVAGNRVRLDDVTGWNFALLTCDLAISQDNRDRAKSLNVVLCEFGEHRLQEDEGVLQEWLASLGGRAVLARPDHVVFGVAADDNGVGALLDQLEAWIKT
ncbi:FAD-binding monooxygenase [Sinorhizobium fredii NGR234]|uniref:FAD-binding monooxygenase n=2 Tax=Rhizobium fredii TaxID=380 RepID=C3MH38_SINFN|nr:FAD-binding monooxygenase [Sinorhizobium fredii NGR234]